MGLYDTRKMSIKTMGLNKLYPKIKTITVNKKTLELAPKQKQKLTVAFSPTNTTQKDLIWTTTNAEYAKVDNEGNVEGVADGKTTIRVTSVENTLIYDECVVIVATDPPVES